MDRPDAEPGAESHHEVDALGDNGGVMASASSAMEMVVAQCSP